MADRIAHIPTPFKLCFLCPRRWKAQSSLSQAPLQGGVAVWLSAWDANVYLLGMSFPLLQDGGRTWWLELWQILYEHEEEVRRTAQTATLLSNIFPLDPLLRTPYCFKPLCLEVLLLAAKFISELIRSLCIPFVFIFNREGTQGRQNYTTPNTLIDTGKGGKYKANHNISQNEPCSPGGKNYHNTNPCGHSLLYFSKTFPHIVSFDSLSHPIK